MKCYSCNKEGLKPHENWPATKILINPATEIAHVCDPHDKIIFKGKWRGFSYRESADISISQERIHAKYLTSLRELFKSPYAE
jgi:hypothetical protein